jgi:hypothetical protein
MIKYGGTCEVLRKYDGICKGWTIVHWDITCRTIQQRENKGAAERRLHSQRSLIGTRDWKWILDGGVLQDIDVVLCAYARTGVTLCLMLDVGSRQRQEGSWLLEPVYRMDNEIK